MIARLRRARNPAVRRGALALSAILGLAACDARPAGDASPFVLTTRGDFVQSLPPARVEVTLGSKLLRPAGFAGELRLQELGPPSKPGEG